MHTPIRSITASVIISLALFALPALAAEGRTPIWQPITIGPGQEGSYVVTRDIVAPAGIPVIDVLPGTVAVQIDLNGFTLFSTDRATIRADGVDSLTIRNGVIMGGSSDGVFATDCRKVVIEDVKVEFVGQYGFQLRNTDHFAVRRNVLISDPAADPMMRGGIYINNGFERPPAEGTIEGNQIARAGNGIIVNNGSSVAVSDNRIEEIVTVGNAMPDGIRVEICGGCLIEKNTIQRVVDDPDNIGGNGINLIGVNVNKVYNNVVFEAGDNGISLSGNSSDCLILDNVASQNQRNGLAIDGHRNHIVGNVVNSNQEAGIWFQPGSTENTYGGNTARGNLAIPAGSPGCAATPPPCFAPDICDDWVGPGPPGPNSTFMDNMGPGLC